MLGGADNPNGELPSYITGADTPALNLATSDAAAVAGLVMTVLTVGLVSCTGKSLPRFWYGDFFPTFYACHLTVLGVLAV